MKLTGGFHSLKPCLFFDKHSVCLPFGAALTTGMCDDLSDSGNQMDVI